MVATVLAVPSIVGTGMVSVEFLTHKKIKGGIFFIGLGTISIFLEAVMFGYFFGVFGDRFFFDGATTFVFLGFAMMIYLIKRDGLAKKEIKMPIRKRLLLLKK